MRTRLPVIAAVIGSCLLPAAAPAAVTEFDVPVGRSVSDQRTFSFKGKTTYTITVSGTITHTYGLNTDIYDGAYKKQQEYDWRRDGSGLTLTAAGSTSMGQAVAEKHGAFHPYPAYREDHTYTFTVAPASETQTLAFWAWPQGQINPSYSEYSGGFHVKIVGPDPEEEQDCPAPAMARVAQASCPAPDRKDTASVGELRGEVRFRVNDGPWQPLTRTTKLREGVEVMTEIDAEVVLKFSDGSEMRLDEMTQVVIDDLLVSGSRQAVAVQLKMGELAAKVNPKKDFQTDFKVRTPEYGASVRGTVFSVFRDPGSKTSLASVTKGAVTVNPTKPGLKTVIVRAGKEVEVGTRSMTKVVRIGTAGARKGNNRSEALDRVLAVIARGDAPCGVTTPRRRAFAIKPDPKGWAVSVKLIGERKGTSKWLVARKKVTPLNRLAKQVKKRCA